MNPSFVAIHALAQAGERMTDLFRWLDAQEADGPTSRATDIRAYSDADAVEMAVERRLSSAGAICYWLEVRVESGAASVEGAVYVQGATGQRTVRETSKTVSSENELGPTLRATAEDLWANKESDLKAARRRLAE